MENGFRLSVTKSHAKRFCHVCKTIFPKEVKHLVRSPVREMPYHYCRACSLTLLQKAIKDPAVGKVPKQTMREQYLKIKVS